MNVIPPFAFFLPLPESSPLDGIAPEAAILGHPVWLQIRPLFRPSEFEAPEKMDVAFLMYLWYVRRLAGVPMRVIDTERAGSRGAHGETPVAAADFQVLSSRERSRIVRAAYRVGFTRIGIYKGSDRLYPYPGHPRARRVRDAGGIHIDGSRRLVSDVLWTLPIR